MEENLYILEYQLETENDWPEDVEFTVGFFTSREACHKAIQEVVTKRMFAFDLSRFRIYKNKLDEIGWTQGFWNPNSEE